jgi:hypothetical protein
MKCLADGKRRVSMASWEITRFFKWGFNSKIYRGEYMFLCLVIMGLLWNIKLILVGIGLVGKTNPMVFANNPLN